MKGQLLFAVTDQFYIIPLQIISEEDIPDAGIKIKTVIVGDSIRHQEVHYEHYFQEMWMDDGVISSSSVFFLESSAKAYACGKINGAIDIKEHELQRLQQRLFDLNN